MDQYLQIWTDCKHEKYYKKYYKEISEVSEEELFQHNLSLSVSLRLHLSTRCLVRFSTLRTTPCELLSNNMSAPFKVYRTHTHSDTQALNLCCLCCSVPGELYLIDVDHSAWGYWQNNVALLGIIFVCMSLAYVQLLRINRWK